MTKAFDCIVCGTCVVDFLVRPVPLEAPIGGNRLWNVDQIATAVGGITSNTGTAMARLGQRVAVFSRVGNDAWASVLRDHYDAERIDCEHLIETPNSATAATAVLIDASGERSFAHLLGASAELTLSDFEAHCDFLANARLVLLGYHSLLPRLGPDLASVFELLKKLGCATALDDAGQGGAMDRLAPALPFVDFYVPSLNEAVLQTGVSDPKRIVAAYRSCGATGVLGVKLGSRGALVSPAADEFFEIPCLRPPGPLVDTTGAGDAFLGGLLSGVLRGFDLYDAAHLAAATAACSVAGCGATAGLRNWKETARIAGLELRTASV